MKGDCITGNLLSLKEDMKFFRLEGGECQIGDSAYPRAGARRGLVRQDSLLDGQPR